MKKNLSVLYITAIAPIVWGSTYMITKLYLPPNIPMISSIIRCLPIGIIMLIWNRKLPSYNLIWKVIIVSLLNISLFQFLLFYSAYRLQGGTAAILTSTQPIFVLLLTVPILGIKHNRTTLLSGLFGFLGVIILLSNKGIIFDLTGYVAAILSAISMGLGTIFTKKWFPNVNQFNLTGWQLTFGGLLLIPVAMISETIPNIFETKNIFAYLWLSFISAGLAYYLWFQGIRRLSIQSVTLLGFLSPASAMILGFVFLDEQFSMREFMGIIMIIASIYFMQTKLNTIEQ
jgi:probable blue pigment (indigoidine) exporter